MGRNPLPEDEKKSKGFRLRMDPNEIKTLKRVADINNEAISDTIRNALHDYYKKSVKE